MRLSTFYYYTGSLNVHLLALNGFLLYCRRTDLMQCFYCGRISNEITQSSIIAQHLKMGKCGFLQKNLSSRQFRHEMRNAKFHPHFKYFIKEQAPFNYYYADCSVRFDSLKKYKTTFSKQQIARSGMYCPPGTKLLACYDCGLLIYNLICNPWHFHAKNSIQCKFLIKTRGHEFIIRHCT